MKIKVLLVDDFAVVQQGLIVFLGADPDLEIVGTALNGLEGVQKTLELKPDVVLMDLIMPELDGIEATSQIKHQSPQTKVLILSGILEIGSVKKALSVGADGYILKSSPPEELCKTIKATATNKIQISTEVAALFVDYETPINQIATLTEREQEILQFISQGHPNKVIAYRMGLSEGTIKTHISVMMAKLNLQSRTQLALYATQKGIFQPQSYTSTSQYSNIA